MTSNEHDGKRRKRRLASTVKDRTVVLLGLVTLAGVTLVCVGGIIQGSGYVPALLLQLGASMMLLVPLALLGFMLEGRLGRAEEQIRATAARLETLTAVTRQQLAENRERRENMFDQAIRTPDEERIHALLSEALQTGAIAASGVRVQLPKSPLRLSFRPDGGRVEVRIEEPDGTVLEHVTWDSSEPVTKFTHHLAGSLKALRRYPGDASFDPTGMLQRLLEVIHTGIKARTGELAQDLGHIIEIPNEQWVISAEGLFSLQRYYHIPAERISGSHEDWPRHMRTQAWVNPSEFDEAYLLARNLLARPPTGENPANRLPGAR